MSASGRGGQPGTYTSTGNSLSTPSTTAYWPGKTKGPPEMAQLPIAMTHLGSEHLVVERLDRLGHLLVDRAGDDHDVGLARRGAEHFGAEAGQVEPRGAGGHHFNGATGQTERQRP